MKNQKEGKGGGREIEKVIRVQFLGHEEQKNLEVGLDLILVKQIKAKEVEEVKKVGFKALYQELMNQIKNNEQYSFLLWYLFIYTDILYFINNY